MLRRYIAQRHDVAILEGATVGALVADGGTPPRVTGVRVEQAANGSQTIGADIVVDASGRHGATDAWLAAIGAVPAAAEPPPCGSSTGRTFYQLNDGADYPVDGRKSAPGGVQGVDLGYLKVGLFRTDKRTFSITLAADPEDKSMRRVANEREFDIAVTNIDATHAWVDPNIAKPISKVYLYGNRANVHKRFVHDAVRVALNYFAIGDAHVHTNPVSGRGCALGWVSAFELAEVLATTADAVERAVTFEARIDAVVLPWYRLQVDQDKQSIGIDKALQRAEDPHSFVRADGSIDADKQRLAIFRKGFGAAAREHLDVLRALFRHTNLLDLPGALFARRELIGKVLASYEKHEGEETGIARDRDELRPPRDEMLALFAAV